MKHYDRVTYLTAQSIASFLSVAFLRRGSNLTNSNRKECNTDVTLVYHIPGWDYQHTTARNLVVQFRDEINPRLSHKTLGYVRLYTTYLSAIAGAYKG